MLYFIVAWTFLLITSTTSGLGFLHGLRAACITRVGDRFILAAWLGIISLAVILLATSLFLPLSPLVGVIVALSLCAVVLVFPAPRKEVVTNFHSLGSRQFGIRMLAVAIVVAAFTTQEVTLLDTGLYHYCNIQWFAQYGSVPGIALLFGNFGFTSSWFALAAPLNPELLQARATATTNGFVLLLMLYQFLIHLKRLSQRKGEIGDRFMVVFLLLFIPLSRLDAISTIFISPSPDAPILMLVGIISWCILTISNNDQFITPESKFHLFNVRAIPLLLAGEAITLKLTAVPLLFIALVFYSFHKGSKLYHLVVFSSIVFLILIPLFAHSLITSGCPLYPSSLLCSNLPWSPSTEDVQKIANSTHGWTTWYGSPSQDMSRWIWAFWKWLNDSRKNWLMVFLIVLSLGCTGYLLKQKFIKHRSGNLWLIALFITGITFFFLTTPFLRFSLSYLLLLPALSIALLLKERFPQSSQILQQQTLISKLGWRVGWVSITLLIVVSLHNKFSQLILPPPLKQVAIVQKQVNNVKYWSPQQPDELCWSTEIPCAFTVPKNVVLRDAPLGVRAGFIRRLA